MPKEYSNDGALLAPIMRDQLNRWPDKPAMILLEDFGREKNSIMIQQLSAAEKKRPYINGSYIGAWNFAVYVRINGRDTKTRIDALKCLEDLGHWLEAKDESNKYINLPYIDDRRTATKITMPNAPSIAAKNDDGTEDYQAIFELEYKYSVRR